jgi:hypothetical protein
MYFSIEGEIKSLIQPQNINQLIVEPQMNMAVA